MKKLIIIAFLLTSGVSHAQDPSNGPHLYGSAVSSCKAYLEVYTNFYKYPDSKKASDDYLVYINWTFGFLTAGSIYTKRMLKLNVNKIDMNASMLYMKKYCQKYPDRLVADAALDLSTGLAKTF